MPNAFRFYVKLTLLVIASGISAACISARPMPKMTRGLTNPAKMQVDAINSSGTEFHFRMDAKNKDGTYMFDKWVCAPGEQVIDMSAWLQEMLVLIGKGARK